MNPKLTENIPKISQNGPKYAQNRLRIAQNGLQISNFCGAAGAAAKKTYSEAPPDFFDI